MFSSSDFEHVKRNAADLGRYSVHVAIALSLVFSLMAIAILSKKDLTNHFWANVATFVLPLPVALYFRSRIVLLGVGTYTAALGIALIAAILFGV